MGKGSDTREEILRVAMHNASRHGLEGLSIGTLARDVGMSKSGLFAHFGSKEELQKAVMARARQAFVNNVLRPAIAEPRGEPRIRALFARWMDWMSASRLPGGCLFAATAWEFDDRPGPVRDVVAREVADLHGVLDKAAQIAIEAGHFRADLDTEQFAYEVHSILLGFQVRDRLLDREDSRGRAQKAFDRLVAGSLSPSFEETPR
jgi:AcrR family transcriptional regulator